MKIAMVTSEANPFVKSGGLADVTYSLSRELVMLGEEVALFMPLYQSIIAQFGDKLQHVAEFDVPMSWRRQYAKVYRTYVDGITFYFIQNDYYFGRDNLYGYNDDLERFAFFTIAVRNAFKALGFKADIVHLHDWQPGMLPVIIREQNQNDPFFQNFKFVLTIHNPAFKGMFDKYFLNNFYELSDSLYVSGKVRFENVVSTLKAAIVYSDKIATVSYTHRDELLSFDSEHGLSSVLELRRQDFCGILNGIDYAEFNPKADRAIAYLFNGVNVTKGKDENKAALLKQFNLSNRGQPVFGLVSRLTWQKGIRLIIAKARHIVANGGSIIILGSGERELEQEIEWMRAQMSENVGIYIGYSNELAHLIYAGSDFFLMPSLFEPCGIGQMIAQRYGTLPIVRFTGGLKDTVCGYNRQNLDEANGFGFEHFDEYGMQYGLDLALSLYQDKEALLKMRRNAMKLDRTWKNSALEYVKLYRDIKE
ncbi:MAG: glycogen synthase [Erysipelotrichaceae bacterium]|jgi:starch synthase|nr:glycogen synthase [Erysipelotrichaceae bacterium]